MGDRVGSEGRNGERSIDGALALLSFVVALVIGYLSQPEGLPFAQHYLFDGYRLGLSSGVTLMLAITMVAISSALVYLTTAHLVRLFASTDNDDGSRSESPATAPAAGFVAAITLPALAAVRGAAVDAAPSLLLLPLVTGGLLCMVLWYRGRGEKNLGGEKVAEDAVAEEAPSVPNGRSPLFLALAFAFALLGLFIDPITFALLPALLLLYWTTRFTGEADPLERPRSIALTGAIAAGLLVLWFAIGSMTAPDDTRALLPTDIPASGEFDAAALAQGTFHLSDHDLRTRIGSGFMRTLLRNVIGRIGDHPDSPWLLYEVSAEERATFMPMSESGNDYPIRFFALPLLLMIVGVIRHIRREWPTGLALSLLFLAAGPIAALSIGTEALFVEASWVVAIAVVALWIGLGAGGLAEGLVELIENAKREKQEAASGGEAKEGALLQTDPSSAENIRRGAIVLAILIGPVNLLYHGWGQHDRSGVRFAEDFAATMLASCPEDAVLFVEGGPTVRPLFRVQAQGHRTDVDVVILERLGDGRYLSRLRDSDIGIVGNRLEPGPGEPTVLSLVDRAGDTVDWSPAGIPLDSTEVFYLPETANLAGLVASSYKRRPLCFAVNVRSEWWSGLDNWFLWRGLVYHVNPADTSGVRVPGYAEHAIDVDGMATVYGEDGAPRGLSNGAGSYRADERRLAIAYRRGLLAWAAATGEDAERGEIIRRMDRTISTTAFPMNYWTAAATALLADEAGADDMAERYAHRAIAGTERIGNRWRYDPIARNYNPHQIAATMLGLLGDYDAAIARYRSIAPDAESDPVVRGLIEELRIEQHLSNGDTAAARTELDAIIAGYGESASGGLGTNRGAWVGLREELGSGE